MKKIYKYLLITLLSFLGSCAAVDEPTAMEVSKSDPIAEMVSNYYNPGNYTNIRNIYICSKL